MIFISILFILYIRDFGPRLFFFIAVLSIILILKVYNSYLNYLNVKWTKAVITLVFLISLADIGKSIALLKEDYDFKKNNHNLILKSNEMVFMSNPNKNKNRFILGHGQGSMGRYDLLNRPISWYYNKEYIIFLPEDLFENVYRNNNLHKKATPIKLPNYKKDSINEELYLLPQSGYLIIPCASKKSIEIKKDAFIEYEATPTIDVKTPNIKQKIKKLIFRKSIEYVMFEKTPCYLLETNHGNYLYFKVPMKISIGHLKNIKVFSKPNQPLLKIEF
jgi:hypothetical protein